MDPSRGKFVQMKFDETDSVIYNGTNLIQNGSMDDVYILDKFS
jgi:hypothetical protein